MDHFAIHFWRLHIEIIHHQQKGDIPDGLAPAMVGQTTDGYDVTWLCFTEKMELNHLVGGFNPSEKY